MKFLKPTSGVLAAFAVLSVFPFNAFADSGSKATSSKFSPDTTYWAISNSTATKTITVRMNGTFSTNRIDFIKLQADTLYYVPGMNFQDSSYTSNDYLSSASTVATNYPNPKTDIEDDDNNGKYEEAEIVSQRPDLMKAGTDYYTTAQYKYTASSGKNQIYGTTHSSLYSLDPSTGQWEYNTVATEAIKYMPYDLSKSISFIQKQSSSLDTHFTSEEGNTKEKKEKIISDIKSDLGYRLIAKEKGNKKVEVEITPDHKNLTSYVNNNNKLLNDLKDSEEVASLITFKKPLSVKEVEAFTKKYKFNATSYTARAFEQDDERITIFGKGQATEINSLNMNELIGETAKFAGVYAIEGTFSNRDKAVAASKFKNAYLVDVIANTVDLETKADVQIEVQSPYWYIEE